MRKLIIAGYLATLFQTAAFAQSIPVKDNGDFALTLSQSNYNRILIKGDEIWDFAYPDGALALKRDKEDGSVYLMPVSANPFTLFLTTKAGRHFSVTLNGEDSLGKTIELVPQQAVVAKNNLGLIQTSTSQKSIAPESIISMISHMERHEAMQGVNIKRQNGRSERWSKGLALFPKELWEGNGVKGEVIELYNGGNESLDLSQEWFVKDQVKAIKFSKNTIAPREHVMLYRVQGVSHG